ncbi:hypothetical protein ACFL96_13315 [Thermoproteota archaeon]
MPDTTEPKESEVFSLPHALKFSVYLRQHLDGKLKAEGPEESGSTKVWKVTLDDDVIGEYRASQEPSEESPHYLSYVGNIPGYGKGIGEDPDFVLLEHRPIAESKHGIKNETGERKPTMNLSYETLKVKDGMGMEEKQEFDVTGVRSSDISLKIKYSDIPFP